MLKFFKKKPKEKSCVNCTYYKKKENRCTATRNSTLRAFPFKKTNCKLFVPRGSLSAYWLAWGFDNIIEE